MPRPPNPAVSAALLSAGVELIEQGFEVVVVRGATAVARAPEGDGYLAAIINFRFLARALWTTEHTLAQLRRD